MWWRREKKKLNKTRGEKERKDQHGGERGAENETDRKEKK